VLITPAETFENSCTRLLRREVISAMMEALNTPKTSVNFYETLRGNIPEYHHLHTRHHENLSSDIGKRSIHNSDMECLVPPTCSFEFSKTFKFFEPSHRDFYHDSHCLGTQQIATQYKPNIIYRNFVKKNRSEQNRFNPH
jgi:hypothetical protein